MKFIRSLVATTLFATTPGLVSSLPVSAIEIAQAEDLQQPTPPVPQQTAPAEQSEPRNRTVWRRGQTLRQEDSWSESTFSVDKEGRRLILAVEGSIELQSAQVQLADGRVQNIQVRQQPYGNGEFLLTEFDSTQPIQSVQVVGRTSSSNKSRFSVQLRT